MMIWPIKLGFLCDQFAIEAMDGLRDVIQTVLHGEVSGVQAVHLRFFEVREIGLPTFAGETDVVLPPEDHACVTQLRSNGVIFRTLSDSRRLLDVLLAWRQGDPSAIRDTFLNLLRKNRPGAERRMFPIPGAERLE